jgi:glycosyltransferase involved in cell wall biosynthesis
MALFVVDYGFCAGSHHYSSACSLSLAAARRRLPFQLFVPRESDPAPAAAPPAARVLSYRLYDNPLAERRSLPSFWSAFCARRGAVRRDLHRQLGRRAGKGDIVLLATPMAPEFAGFADWLASLPAERRPAAAAHFLLPLGYELAADRPWQEEFALLAYREAFARLRASAGDRSLCLAHPRALARRLAEFDRGIEVCPSPFALAAGAHRPPGDARLCIGVLGRGKVSKGIELAFDAFDRLQAAGAAFRWIFQTAPLELAPERRAALDAPNVTHERGFATHARYAELLRAVSIVLLPYDPAAYQTDQGSGILCETRALGIPAVCSETPHFVEQLGQLGCPELVFRPHSGEALAATIMAAAAEYPRYRRRFAAHAEASAVGATPEWLLDRLEALAGAPAPAGLSEAARIGKAALASALPDDPRNAASASFLSLLNLRVRALAPRRGARRA